MDQDESGRAAPFANCGTSAYSWRPPDGHPARDHLATVRRGDLMTGKNPRHNGTRTGGLHQEEIRGDQSVICTFSPLELRRV